MLYKKDLIAERDTWQKMKNSVVKWWQVNYINDVTVLEAGQDKTIRKTVQHENKYETKPLYKQENAEDDFNAATGSYSGAYGKVVTLDQSGLDQVASILSEKSNQFQQMFDSVEKQQK